jgi:hypothetical protein
MHVICTEKAVSALFNRVREIVSERESVCLCAHMQAIANKRHSLCFITSTDTMAHFSVVCESRNASIAAA